MSGVKAITAVRKKVLPPPNLTNPDLYTSSGDTEPPPKKGRPPKGPIESTPIPRRSTRSRTRDSESSLRGEEEFHQVPPAPFLATSELDESPADPPAYSLDDLRDESSDIFEDVNTTIAPILLNPPREETMDQMKEDDPPTQDTTKVSGLKAAKSDTRLHVSISPVLADAIPQSNRPAATGAISAGSGSSSVGLGSGPGSGSGSGSSQAVGGSGGHTPEAMRQLDRENKIKADFEAECMDKMRRIMNDEWALKQKAFNLQQEEWAEKQRIQSASFLKQMAEVEKEKRDHMEVALHAHRDVNPPPNMDRDVLPRCYIVARPPYNLLTTAERTPMPGTLKELLPWVYNTDDAISELYYLVQKCLTETSLHIRLQENAFNDLYEGQIKFFGHGCTFLSGKLKWKTSFGDVLYTLNVPPELREQAKPYNYTAKWTGLEPSVMGDDGIKVFTRDDETQMRVPLTISCKIELAGWLTHEGIAILANKHANGELSLSVAITRKWGPNTERAQRFVKILVANLNRILQSYNYTLNYPELTDYQKASSTGTRELDVVLYTRSSEGKEGSVILYANLLDDVRTECARPRNVETEEPVEIPTDPTGPTRAMTDTKVNPNRFGKREIPYVPTFNEYGTLDRNYLEANEPNSQPPPPPPPAGGVAVAVKELDPGNSGKAAGSVSGAAIVGGAAGMDDDWDQGFGYQKRKKAKYNEGRENSQHVPAFRGANRGSRAFNGPPRGGRGTYNGNDQPRGGGASRLFRGRGPRGYRGGSNRGDYRGGSNSRTEAYGAKPMQAPAPLPPPAMPDAVPPGNWAQIMTQMFTMAASAAAAEKQK